MGYSKGAASVLGLFKEKIFSKGSVISALFEENLKKWEHFVQSVAVMHYIFVWVLLPIFSVWVPFYLICTRFWPVMAVYACWTAYNMNAPRQGSFGGWKLYKNSRIWKYFAGYFPIRLVKTAELSPEKNYIIGSHPHGVLSVGGFTSLVTDGTDFSKLFPGIKSTLLTLNGQFYFPFRRDIGIALGGVESSKESLTYLLKNPGKGRAIGIVLGGATEALDSRPGCFDVNILSRRGFCRYAIKYGADLVPMYNFGENDLYDQFSNPRGSLLRIIQTKIKNAAGFCPPLFHGRGIINRFFGMLPYRKPITSVVGQPLSVIHNPNPTEKEIDELHARYCEALVKLFEEHKHLHDIPQHIHLNLY